MNELILADRATPYVTKIIRRGLSLESCPGPLADELLAWCNYMDEYGGKTIKAYPSREEIYKWGHVDPHVRLILDYLRAGVLSTWEEAMTVLAHWLLEERARLEELVEELRMKTSVYSTLICKLREEASE
jgi:hypothetical protein